MDIQMLILSLPFILLQGTCIICSSTSAPGISPTSAPLPSASMPASPAHCAFNPCYHGGTCHPAGGYFYCECPQDYTGEVCQHRATTTTTTTSTTTTPTTTTQNPLPHECPFNVCRNGGFCVASLDRYECFCPPGVTGILCGDVNGQSSAPIDAQACPFNPCSNGGFCVSAGQNFKCYCPQTHAGKFCDENVATSPTLTTKPSTTTITTVATNDCRVDLQFLLDCSGSVGRHNFATMLSFTKTLVSNLESHHHDAKIGLTTFSETVHQSFPLSSYSTILSAIGRIAYLEGGTNTANALEYIRQHAFTTSRGDRSNAPNVMVFIADGKSNDPNAAIAEAEKLRNEGVKIIAVGVGSSVDRAELTRITGDSSHVFTVSDFDALKNVENDLLLMTCLDV